MKNNFYLAIGFVMYFLLGCQSDPMMEMENPEPVAINHEQLFFTVSSAQETMIYESRDTTYELTNPVPQLRFKADSIELKKMKIRGTSASRVRRKSYNVDTYDPISFDTRDEIGQYETEDFRLLALSQDLCYIENRIGFGLLQQNDLFPLFFKYVEVQLNEETNGVYLMIENPNDYFLDRNDHSILIRRGYYGSVDSYKYEDNGDGFSEQDYVDAFNSIYSRLRNYEGEALYAQLDQVLDIRQYMQKIAFDYLIKNGDYTDEIYLYDEPGDNEIRYRVLPWDLDDLFTELPHEIGSTWGTGMLFGDRGYASVEDVIADVGEKLIYSIEDDIDYIIAKDPYLYAVYLEEMQKLMTIITEDDINLEFIKIEEELMRLFDHKSIYAQSEHDVESCDPGLLRDELRDKKTFLINRRQAILDQL